jgi:hypothetical protein
MATAHGSRRSGWRVGTGLFTLSVDPVRQIDGIAEIALTTEPVHTGL